MTKPKRYGPEYSREREFKVVLEDLRSEFRVFGEGLEDIRIRVEHIEVQLKEDVGQLKEDVGQLKEDVSVIKSAFPRFVLQVSDHEKRITILERAR